MKRMLMAVAVVLTLPIQSMGSGGDLHKAALIGPAVAVDVLLHGGAKVNERDDHGLTPLHWAAMGGQVEAIKVLLKAGANVNAGNPDGGYGGVEGRSPLHGSARPVSTICPLVLARWVQWRGGPPP